MENHQAEETFVLAPYFFPWRCGAPPHFYHSRISTAAVLFKHNNSSHMQIQEWECD